LESDIVFKEAASDPLETLELLIYEMADMRLQIKIMGQALALALSAARIKSVPVTMHGGHTYAIVLDDEDKKVYIMPCNCKSCRVIVC